MSENNESLEMYPVNAHQVRLGCNEFDDVEILVSNVDNNDEAKEKATMFLQHLIKNGFHW